MVRHNSTLIRISYPASILRLADIYAIVVLTDLLQRFRLFICRAALFWYRRSPVGLAWAR